jgi:hypothetical protein
MSSTDDTKKKKANLKRKKDRIKIRFGKSNPAHREKLATLSLLEAR